MDIKLQELADYIREKFSLENYYLKRHSIFREKNAINETAYILTLEWFPKDHQELEEEDYNPTGTVVIDVDFHTKAIKSIIFVNGVSDIQNADTFPISDKEGVIDWVENMTGLTFGKQFQFVYEDDSTIRFQATVDNIAVFPSGTINIGFNDQGQLTLFSIDGVFPDEEQVHWEPFSLIPEAVEHISKEQCKLVEIPVEAEEKWLSIYVIEEAFITNDGEQTVAIDEHNLLGMHAVLEWDEPINDAFQSREVDLSSEVSLDVAVKNEAHPDTFPITVAEQEACVQGARNFLRREFPNDSGQWIVKSLRRENGYMLADLYPTASSTRAFVQKIRLVIDCETYNVVNYMDGKLFLEMFKHYEEPADVSVTSEIAFEKLRAHINVLPVYVYNHSAKGYELYGKVACPYGVDAATGELISLNRQEME